MSDGDGYWIKVVLSKLKRMLVAGAFIPGEEVRYIFLENTPVESYDEEQVRNEDRALLYLLRTGVVRGERVPNEYRQQELERRREEGIGVWADWEKVDPTYREYAWITSLYGVDIDRFERELKKFNLMDAGARLIDKKPNNASTKLTVRSYDPANGILHITGTAVQIVKQKNRLSSKNESLQGRAMRLLFNDVNSMKNGVPLRRIARFSSVNGQPLSKMQQASAKNQITEINNKVKSVSGGKKLIRIARDKCYIDPMYL
jgi:hypothetical protein